MSADIEMVRQSFSVEKGGAVIDGEYSAGEPPQGFELGMHREYDDVLARRGAHRGSLKWTGHSHIVYPGSKWYLLSHWHLKGETRSIYGRAII